MSWDGYIEHLMVSLHVWANSVQSLDACMNAHARPGPLLLLQTCPLVMYVSCQHMDRAVARAAAA